AVRLVDALDGVAGVNNTLGEGSRDQFVHVFELTQFVFHAGVEFVGGIERRHCLLTFFKG
ncbi:hypothetical protein ABJZ27_22675, partial [Vibrio parahaemolyticus]|uniref:hypothetical protein n=1 Tax=Vibrio parahaemolyticus TaxID=670 RepID=UPI0032AED7C7